MLLTINLKDNGLGFGSATAKGMAVIGVSSAGIVNQVYGIGSPQLAYDTFGKGDLPDSIGVFFQNDGQGPVYGVRATTTTNGSYVNYQKSVHAAHLATGANLFPTVVQPTYPRNLEMVFEALWDGGNVTVVGTGEDDAAITEVFTAATGTVVGLRVFKTITSITKAAIGVAVKTCTVYTGNKSTEGASSSNAKLTTSGNPLASFEMIVELTRSGDVAAGTPAFRASFDGGQVYTDEIAIPAGGVYSGFSSTHGVTLTFVGTAVKDNDEFTFKTTGPSASAANIITALTALAADPRTWEFVHILGNMDSAQAALVESWISTQRSAGRWIFAIGSARDNTEGETNAARQTALLTDYAGFLSTYGQLSAVGSYVETVLPGRLGIHRKSGAWTIAPQISRTAVSEHIGAPAGAGPLRGIYKGDAGGLYHDERIEPGLGGAVGRMMTLQTLIGMTGAYVGDSTGKRSPGTLAAGTSDWSLLMNVRVGMQACRVLQEKGPLLLARKLATKIGGTLLESEALGMEKLLTQWLKIGMGAEIVRCRVVVDRAEPILTSKRLVFQVFLTPYAYALELVFNLGFEGALV